MRTTLVLDDDLMVSVRIIARRKRESIGRTVSDLIRRGLKPEKEPVVEVRNGVPSWRHGPHAIPVTSYLVRNLRDEE